MDPATLSLIKGVIDEGKANNKEQWDNARGVVGTALDVGGFAGDLAVGNANKPDDQPDVRQAAVGGAASGAAKGFKSGGIFGALAGALGGAASAGLSTAKHRQDFEETQERDFEQMMNDATRMPFVGYAQEGGVSGLEIDAEIIPIQAELGENVMLKDFSITDVKADKSHDESEKGDVSDVLPKGSVVFSSDEGSLIYKDKIDDDSNLIAYKPVYYEDGDKSKTGKTERVLFTDLYKDNEDALTPAELAKRIKKLYPTVDNDKDIFALNTNEQNKESRAAYLGRLIALQEKRKLDKGKPSMEQEYIPEFRGGGVVGSDEDPPELYRGLLPTNLRGSGNGPSMMPDLIGPGDTEGALLPEASVKADRPWPVDWERAEKGAQRLPTDDRKVDPSGSLIGRVRSLQHTPPSELMPNTPVSISERGGRSTTPVSLLPQDQAKSYVASVSQNPEQLLKDVADGKVSKRDLQEIKALGDPRISKAIDDMFSKLGGRIDQMEKRNSKNRVDQLRRANNAFRKKRGYNALRFGSAAAGVLGQSNREDPVTKSAGDVAEMFADTPESIIATQENQARAGATANTEQLENMGASASQIMANNASANSAIQDTISRVRGQFEMQRANNRSRRAQLQNKVENFNKASRIKAGNAERTNQNQAIADLFGASGNYFERAERISDQELTYENAVDREFNQNDQVLFNDELEMGSNKLGYEMNNIYGQKRVDALNNQARAQREDAQYNRENRVRKNPVNEHQYPTQDPYKQPENEYYNIPRDGREGLNLIQNAPTFDDPFEFDAPEPASGLSENFVDTYTDKWNRKRILREGLVDPR